MTCQHVTKLRATQRHDVGLSEDTEFKHSLSKSNIRNLPKNTPAAPIDVLQSIARKLNESDSILRGDKFLRELAARLRFELSGGVNSRLTGDLIFNASDVPHLPNVFRYHATSEHPHGEIGVFEFLLRQLHSDSCSMYPEECR